MSALQDALMNGGVHTKPEEPYRCPSCKLIIDVEVKGNEAQPDYCYGCACDHSFNCDGVCEYCGEAEQ